MQFYHHGMNGQVVALHVVPVIIEEQEFVMGNAATFRWKISQNHRFVMKSIVQKINLVHQVIPLLTSMVNTVVRQTKNMLILHTVINAMEVQLVLIVFVVKIISYCNVHSIFVTIMNPPRVNTMKVIFCNKTAPTICSKNLDTNFIFQAECIVYRENLRCTGDIIWETPSTSPTLTSSPTYQTPEGYGRCASVCIGIDGAIAFNWINKGSAQSTCECLRMVSNFSIFKHI